jgi:hypothetical protein
MDENDRAAVTAMTRIITDAGAHAGTKTGLLAAETNIPAPERKAQA